MTGTSDMPPRAPSKLQAQLAAQIARHIRAEELAPGTPLTEIALADQFGVSRSPIRAALEYLAAQGAIDATARRGYAVAAQPVAFGEAIDEDGADDDALSLAIARDYTAGRLPSHVSEADMMRRYDVTRGPLLRVLQGMARDGLVERSQGHGWHFGQMVNSIEAHDASYRFRMAVEPAAILEPGYTLDPRWARRAREAHEDMLKIAPDRLSTIAVARMNADFHAMIAAGSQNAFFIQAVDQQNRLRRFLDYDVVMDAARIRCSCLEHLEILTMLETHDHEWAAALMRRHIECAARITPSNIGGS